jgi:hypothetical protein
MGSLRSRVAAAIAAFASLTVAVPDVVQAQSAWVPFAGEANVSFDFHSLDHGGHYDDTGTKRPGVGETQSFYAIVKFEYGLTDQFALTARLPYVASRYTGALDEPLLLDILKLYDEYRQIDPAAAVSVDTGDYYGALQDFVFTLRYNVLERGLTVTPVLGVIVPSHDYRTVGEAAAGQGLKVLQAGVNVGRLLDPVLPKAYVHTRYTYSFVEEYRDIPLDRSTAEFEVGYGISPTLVVRGLANWMTTHGGLSWQESLQDLSLFLQHDRLLSSSHWHMGAAATVTLTDALDLDASFFKFITGNTTRYGVGFSVGLTWRVLEPRIPESSTRVRPPAGLGAGRRGPVSAARSR